MNAFRVRHLENFISLYSARTASRGGQPLDGALRKYFSAHDKRVDSKDRQWLSLHAKELLRWEGLLETTTIGKKDWSHKIATYFSDKKDWRKGTTDSKLPVWSRLSVSEELYNKLVSQFGQVKTEKICKIFNENTNKIYLRTNLLKTSRDQLHKKLLAHKLAIEKSPYTETGLVLAEQAKLADFPEFASGLCEIQDDASQLKAAQVKALPGNIVLELSAGHGGNALIYAAKMNNLGHVFLLDKVFDNSRTRGLVKKRFRQAGLKCYTILQPPAAAAAVGGGGGGRVAAGAAGKLRGRCDWVVVDAPSTGSAVYRKYPELKSGYSEKRLHECVDKQRELFKEAVEYVKQRGGKIVYGTHSIFAEENTEQIEYFCQTYNLELVEEPLFILPQSNGMNGLFVAVMQKR